MGRRKSLILSTVIVAVIVAILWSLCPVIFQNDDDKVLLYLTAGYATGTPEIGTIFGAFYWYAIVAFLYRVYSGLCWYTIVELTVIAFSLIVIMCSLLQVIKDTRIVIALAVFVCMMLTTFCYFSAALQYTATAGLIGGAASCLLLSKKNENTQITAITSIISVVALLVVSFGVRKQFGLVSMTSVLVILAMDFIFQKNKQGRLLIIRQLMLVIVIMLIAYISNSVYEKKTGIAEFNEYYAQAGKWIDYPHLKYEDDLEGVYELVGWDETLYEVASNWYFMDENLTTENFEKINAAYSYEDTPIKEKIKKSLSLLQHCNMCNLQVGIWVVLICASIVVAVKRKRGLKEVLTLSALFAMFIILTGYFLMQGRYPIRVYQALLFIYYVPSVILVFRFFGECESNKAPIIYTLLAIAALIISIIKIPDGNMLRVTQMTCNDKYRFQDTALCKALDEYAINNPDNIYIYDLSLILPVDSFVTYGGNSPKNAMFWGGWIYNTPLYWKQVRECGMEHIYSEDLLKDNVYVCSIESPDKLIEYMYARYQGCKCDIIDKFDGITVYQFRN